MKLYINQLQYIVNMEEFENLEDGKITINNISSSKIFGEITKILDSKYFPIPHIGEHIEDSYWPKDFSKQKIIDVTYVYCEDECYVTLEPFFMVENSSLFENGNLNNEEKHNLISKIAENHDWEYTRLNFKK